MRFPEFPSDDSRPLPPGVEVAINAISLREDLIPIGEMSPEAYFLEMADQETYPKLSRKLVEYARAHSVLLPDGTPAHEGIIRPV